MAPTQSQVEREMREIFYDNLYTVEGVLVDRYNQALKMITGKTTALPRFRVDKRGKSPEITEELGVDYLNIGQANRFLIVVSPDQREAPLTFHTTSFDSDLIDMAFNQNTRTIHTITQREAMFAEIDDHLDKYHSLDDLINVQSVSIRLDTPGDTIKKMWELQEANRKFGEGRNWYDQAYINRMLELVREVGDVRKVTLPKITEKQVGNFHVEIFGGAYFFRTLPDANRRYQQFFIVANGDEFHGEYPKTLIAKLREPETLDALHSFGLVGYDFTAIDARQTEIETEVFLQAGLEPSTMTPIERKRVIVGLKQGLPSAWRELQQVKTVLAHSGFYNLSPKEQKRTAVDANKLLRDTSYETRLKLTRPVTEETLLHHLLSEIDPTDVRRLYTYNRNDFFNTFGRLPENRQRYMLSVAKDIEQQKEAMKK